MSFDITRLLENWDYVPGQVVVRRFTGQDGVDKIQLRVDLGILQMNAEGRPDGRRPNGYPSLFEYQQSRLQKHRESHDGNAEGFTLNDEECSKLQLEALQYHHRYICLLELAEYERVHRDTERNLALFDFVQAYAANPDFAWSVQQFRPQVIMLRTRALSADSMEERDFTAAIQLVNQGMDEIKRFYNDMDRADLIEQCSELESLEVWLEDLEADRPLTERAKLEQELQDALRTENYEQAAQVRDALRKLPSESKG